MSENATRSGFSGTRADGGPCPPYHDWRWQKHTRDLANTLGICCTPIQHSGSRPVSVPEARFRLIAGWRLIAWRRAGLLTAVRCGMRIWHSARFAFRRGCLSTVHARAADSAGTRPGRALGNPRIPISSQRIHHFRRRDAVPA